MLSHGKAIQSIDQQLIEAVQAGIGENAGAGGPAGQRQGAGDAIIGVDGADLDMVESAVTFGELPLGGDGLAFALFFGGDTEVEGDRHAHTCVARRGRKCKGRALPSAMVDCTKV
jgi:hypothetical protein